MGKLVTAHQLLMIGGIVSQLEQRAIAEPIGLLRLTLLDRDVRSLRQGYFVMGLCLI